MRDHVVRGVEAKPAATSVAASRMKAVVAKRARMGGG